MPMNRHTRFTRRAVVLLLVTGGVLRVAMAVAAGGSATDCNIRPGTGEAAPVAAAAVAFRTTLAPAQRAQLDQPLSRATAVQWSNLPVGLVPRIGVRIGDLNEQQAAALRSLLTAALSACGLKLYDEIRLADESLVPLDKQHIGWGGGNYYVAFLGTPSAEKPWILQTGGHHLAYNFAFNGPQAGATPLFFGTEPIRFDAGGVTHEPLQAQSTAMSALAAALAAYPAAHLPGTYTDVVKGVLTEFPVGTTGVRGTDAGFPQTYPTGTTDRGIRYSALTPAAQARVRAALESYLSLPGEAMTRALLAAYESPQALNETYVGYAGAVDLSVRGSYVRIDGPRVWMEFVVQPAVARPADLHYHALWRDKLADYGGEIR
jgi:hypothetical protein